MLYHASCKYADGTSMPVTLLIMVCGCCRSPAPTMIIITTGEPGSWTRLERAVPILCSLGGGGEGSAGNAPPRPVNTRQCQTRDLDCCEPAPCRKHNKVEEWKWSRQKKMVTWQGVPKHSFKHIFLRTVSS